MITKFNVKEMYIWDKDWIVWG